MARQGIGCGATAGRRRRPGRRASRPALAPLRVLALALAATAGLGVRCAPRCPAVEVELPEFLLGFSQTPADVVGIASEIGVRVVRLTFSWRAVEPTLTPTGLRLDDVRADADAVPDYIASRSWASFETRVDEAQAADLTVVPIVGHGFTTTLPLWNGKPVAPDVLGRAEYLARQYMVTRATVERFDGDGVLDAPGSPRIALWQIENELNQAMFTATALVTTNFHTDVHPGLNLYFDQPPWPVSILAWREHLDVIGVDAYPNYYESAPVRGAEVGERVAVAAQLACGRPVLVMETGYPTGPAERGYDEAKQALYLQESFDAAVAAGASGFLWFGARTADTHSVVITPEDVENLALLGGFFESGDAEALLLYAFENLEYVQGHLAEVVQSVEPYWGIVRPDGAHKAAWDVFAGIAASATPLP